MMTIPDPRHISYGRPIPSEGYADQPYVVQTDDGAWLLTMTTGRGHEGQGGQHVISMRSTDYGMMWGDVTDVEPANGPEASYSVLLKVPSGRIYCFYNHNTDNQREVKTEDGGTFSRVDSLGHYVFKYSDDHGRSWSAQRYELPIRDFACDRENVYGGAVRFFWNVGRPLVRDREVFLVLHKVGAMGEGFFAQSEGALLHSPNLLTEPDPMRITFETLPEGEVGLCAPVGGGRVAEEQSVSRLSDGSLFIVYRTVDGSPAHAYSRDGGRNWTAPAYLTYTPGGRRVKHPRAANFCWRCENGMFLYWFHNHGGPFVRNLPGWDPYNDRNPVWLMAGREVETPQGRMLEWSQPEILLYDDDPYIRMSYPDLIEKDGRFWITETQKTVGRVHDMPDEIVQGLFNQWTRREVAREGLLVEWAGDGLAEVALPPLPRFTQRDNSRMDYAGQDMRAGISMECRLRLESLAPGQVLLDNRLVDGRGFSLRTVDGGALAIILHDGQTQQCWVSDPVLTAGREHHVVVTLDGGPKIITFVIDGILCDGGDDRQFGWGRFSPHLQSVNGAPNLRIAAGVQAVRVYGRALRTSEAVGNYRAGCTGS